MVPSTSRTPGSCKVDARRSCLIETSREVRPTTRTVFAALEQRLGEMRTDQPCTASNEEVQRETGLSSLSGRGKQPMGC